MRGGVSSMDVLGQLDERSQSAHDALNKVLTLLISDFIKEADKKLFTREETIAIIICELLAQTAVAIAHTTITDEKAKDRFGYALSAARLWYSNTRRQHREPAS